VFELKQQSRNYRHVGNFPTCRQMSCRLDTLADTTFSCVCDVTSDVSRHVARHDTECRHLGTKTTRRHPTYGAKSAVEWASAPSATKYGQAAHNARHMIEWGQYPFNNKETLKQGNKGFAWRHRTPATAGTWKETFLEWSLPNKY